MHAVLTTQRGQSWGPAAVRDHDREGSRPLTLLESHAAVEGAPSWLWG